MCSYFAVCTYLHYGLSDVVPPAPRKRRCEINKYVVLGSSLQHCARNSWKS